MASIKKIEGKTGTSYKITVTKGRDSSGKQIRHFKTWVPDRPMTARQMEKEVQRVALDFEREIDLGFQMDNRQTFEEYAQYVIALKERQGAAKNSLAIYHQFMGKIVPVIGHMRLADIRPQHLNLLYQELGKPGSRFTMDSATAKVDIRPMAVGMGYTQKGFAEVCSVCEDIIRRAYRRKSIRMEYAERVAKALDRPCVELFEITQKREETLSSNTIRRLHSFVSVVFTQAEKEMLIQFNPAQKVTLPKVEPHTPNYFQPEQLISILEALEKEPVRWQAMINLFIVSGARRGEVLGLKWDKVDFENRQIKIDTCLSYLADVGIYEGPTKTRNTRYITLPDETMALLRQYRVWQAEQQLKHGDQWTCGDYVFTGDRGGCQRQ